MPLNAGATAAIDQLFDDARAHGGFDYALTLLRVSGIERKPDELVELGNTASRAQLTSAPLLVAEIRRLLVLEAPLGLIANLLNCSVERPYQPFPFRHLIRGEGYPYTHPTPQEKVTDLLSRAELTGREELVKLIQSCYLDHGLLDASPRINVEALSDLKAVLEECVEYWKALLSLSQAERLAFGTSVQLVRWPNFEVLELLCNNEDGLFGFQVYFSNGSHASFARLHDRTESINLMLRETVGFMVGDLDALRPEWRVGDKRLYEMPLPGRYNELGIWKPLVFPGPTDSLRREIEERSKDGDVQGTLFYMLCTGHRVIEFVVRASLDLPIDKPIQFGSVIHPVHLWKCPTADGALSLYTIYDGWVTLQTGIPEEISAALYRIGVALNRMGFAFGADLTWRVKYSNRPIRGGVPTPTTDELSYSDKFLLDIPYALDLAIDWYNRGRNSRNPFTAFLCYFVAIEIVVEAAYDDEIPIEVPRPTRPQRREARLHCIDAKHSALFPSDPVRFVEEAYFECVKSLARRRRDVCEAVFGPAHAHLLALFQPSESDGASLQDIRDYVAHGGVAQVDPGHIEMVGARLPQIAQIAREFLSRVILNLGPQDVLPEWSGQYAIGMSTSDPRSTFVTSSLDILPQTDWRIRAEWCE